MVADEGICGFERSPLEVIIGKSILEGRFKLLKDLEVSP
jgi:hypothetical protein